MAADSREVFPTRPRALSRIQIHRRIARVGAPWAASWVMKFAAGEALKQVNEGDGADVNELY